MIHDPFVLSRFDAYDDDDTEKGFNDLLINFFVELFTTHVLLLILKFPSFKPRNINQSS